MHARQVAGFAVIAAVMSVGVNAASQAPPRPQTSTPAPAARPVAPASTRNADNGKKLFVKYGCYECHGREAQGGAAGPRLGPNPLSYPALVRYVRAPRGEMPPYTDKLIKSEQDLSDIHAFLASRPAPPPASVLPPQ